MTRVTMEDNILKTDLLIVGAGPAGAALACFLASHGRSLTSQHLVHSARC